VGIALASVTVMRKTIGLLLCVGCATVVDGNQRALFYSAGNGLSKNPVSSGWHWHMPWNHYVVYDLRWISHTESIHIHSKDGLHMDLDVTIVVRPNPDEIFALDHDVGPSFYDQVVKPAVFGAARDAVGQYDHFQIVTQTHDVEHAIHDALLEHLNGQHLQVGEVAIQHFDLPPELEEAANRTAASSQLLAAKDVDLHLAERDAEVDKARKRGALEAEGLEKQLRAQQELEQTNTQIQIEETKAKADKEKVQAEADAVVVRAEADAKATQLRADAEKANLANLTPNYLRLQALETLAKALSNGNTKIMVLPTDKNGTPAFFGPFMNPFTTLDGLTGPQQ
jgi:regulator of protease activity HflC (stomatin/prohibitin superfamily)